MSELISEISILTPKANIFSENNVKYVIPLYQRAFAWKEKEISQLIEDISDFEEDNYYIGSLIVSKNKNIYEVIDGQQRLTALFLLLNALGVSVKNNLTFACRERSNHALKNINTWIFDEGIDPVLQEGKIIINSIIKAKNFDKKTFLVKLKKVKLYRIEVPENTDLNRYFEIMNTRGEQLEQHDILKATLMRVISNEEQRAMFAKIWEACSDMTGYVQMHFDTRTRSEIFKNKWGDLPTLPTVGKASNHSKNVSFTIKDIIKPTFNVENIDGITENDERVRFESIISFPFFLLHVLKVFVSENKVQHCDIIPSLLDDKKLMSTFGKVIKSGEIQNKSISSNKENFSWKFIKCLLKCRFLFDKYIIKREYTNEYSDGKWSLKELKVSGQSTNKKPYYVNTSFAESGEWESTYAPRTEINIMLQSCLRVSYTSPKIMHWITTLLRWLYSEENLSNLSCFETQIEDVAKSAVAENYLLQVKDDVYNWGTDTPHVVFNYLDYLLWRESNNTYKDFVFEFRNSVEHWYPQNPSEGTFLRWTHEEGLNGFGNLCLIQRSTNSKFSNMTPEAKASTFSNMIEKGSLKLRLMSKLSKSSQRWKEADCKKHENKMLEILKQTCLDT